jgi:spermidine synthase
VNATALLLIVLVIAAAGLVYELVIAAVASYLLGDSVTQFSTVIGVYLSALGLGAYLSQYIRARLALAFVNVELATALFGGLSAPFLFVAFANTPAFHVVLYAVCALVGVLAGLELPLLIRLLRRAYELDQLIARALSFDYAGALIGSLAFSFWLVPHLGLLTASLACGFANAAVGLASTWVLVPTGPEEARELMHGRYRGFAVTGVLGGLLLASGWLSDLTERSLYEGSISRIEQSPHQRIVITQNEKDHFRFYLNGGLQFDSRDEHRYHEALVHPAMALAGAPKHVLVAGGGDGLAAREILSWRSVESLTVVDLDRAVTDLALQDPQLSRLNRAALADPRTRVVNADAMRWLEDSSAVFDVIVLDFPDPSNYSVGKLYTERFYSSVRRRLAEHGALAVQSTSPMFGREAFWCIISTLERSGFHVAPYHVFVPAFGEWGFALAKRSPFTPPTQIPGRELRYLSPAVLGAAFRFPADMARVATSTNRLDNQALVAYYVSAWSRWE